MTDPRQLGGHKYLKLSLFLTPLEFHLQSNAVDIRNNSAFHDEHVRFPEHVLLHLSCQNRAKGTHSELH